MSLFTIYLVCAAAGGTLLVLRVILMLVGLDNAGGAADGVDLAQLDHGGDLGGHEGSFNFLSIQSIASFLTIFGLVGMGLLRINASDVLSLLGALAAGAVTAWATGMIFMSMRRLQSEGTLQVSNAVGQVGTVYLTIPEKGSGVVNITVQGAQRTLDAVSDNGQRIHTGTIVRVVGITAGKVLVVSEQTAERT
jgi:hypothetical protein